MNKKIIDSTRARLVDGVVIKNESVDGETKPTLTLDEMLNRQLVALERVTNQLSRESLSGLNKDEIASLATCIKLTMDLKAKQKSLLDDLSEEELQALAEKSE
jgi:phage FluMu protein gp41